MASLGKKSVLFVCLGNVCRSPIAEAVLVNLLRERGVADQWHVDSAGTGEWYIGQLPYTFGRQCLESHNLTTTHKARLVCEDDFRQFDFIFGMDNNNVRDLLAIQPSDSKAKLEMFGDFDPLGAREVPDPIHDGIEGFEPIYQQCLRCCNAFLEKHV